MRALVLLVLLAPALAPLASATSVCGVSVCVAAHSVEHRECGHGGHEGNAAGASAPGARVDAGTACDTWRNGHEFRSVFVSTVLSVPGVHQQTQLDWSAYPDKPRSCGTNISATGTYAKALHDVGCPVGPPPRVHALLS
jgi:hypothetical protein